MESQDLGNSDEEYYLELSSYPIRFEPVNDVTDVFFDDSKQQVFAIRSGGVTGVLVKALNQDINFRMEDKGSVISIKFSPDMNVLAIQRTVTSVEFINFLSSGNLDEVEFSQSCKGKNATILGFVWTFGSEILFVTDHGVELYQVLPEKRCVKALKSISLAINWFIYCPQSSLVLLSTGTAGNQMQALHITLGNLQKITKFEIDNALPKSGKLVVSERDVALAVLYGIPTIIVLRHQAGDALGTNSTTFVHVYTVHKMVTVRKSHVLNLGVSGRFAINVVDNLIIVHHQASKTSMIFDIMMPGTLDGNVTHHNSIVPPKQMKPYSLRVPGPNITEYINQQCELYSPNWVVFQPNIIIDAKLGCLWYVELKIKGLVKLITEKVKIIELLLQRKNSKQILMDILKEHTMNIPLSLSDLPSIFFKINSIYRDYLQTEIQSVMGTPIQITTKSISPVSENYKFKLLIDQNDMFSHIFSKFKESSVDSKMIIWILLEYTRSLTEHGIPVQHYLHELIITTLVHQKAYYQLHQLLQYNVITDSKPLACLLLSLENSYPAAYQLALDMLQRLGNAHEEIIEILLSKGLILPALRYLQTVGEADKVCARKFLEAAKSANNPMLFHSVYKFFEQRNVKLHNTVNFPKGEHYITYVQYFKSLFQQSDNDSTSDSFSIKSGISSKS